MLFAMRLRPASFIVGDLPWRSRLLPMVVGGWGEYLLPTRVGVCGDNKCVGGQGLTTYLFIEGVPSAPSVRMILAVLMAGGDGLCRGTWLVCKTCWVAFLSPRFETTALSNRRAFARLLSRLFWRAVFGLPLPVLVWSVLAPDCRAGACLGGGRARGVPHRPSAPSPLGRSPMLPLPPPL